MRPYLLLFVTLFLLSTLTTFAQKRKQHTLLWEVSNNGVKDKSYIFGTNHIFDGTWLDSFTVVKEKLLHSQVVVGESLLIRKRIEARPKLNRDTLKRKSFDQLFLKEEYLLVDTYMQSIGLSSLDKAPRNDPSVVLRVYYAILGHQFKKQLAIKENDKSAIDVVIQKIAEQDNKRLIGPDHLDSSRITDRSKATDESISDESLAKSILFLVKDVNDGGGKINTQIDKSQNSFTEWSNLKVQYNLKKHDPQKDLPLIKKLSIDRSEKWVQHLPAIMQAESAFIAVGLRHLKYKEGIISRLRELGYKVRPVSMERKHGS